MGRSNHTGSTVVIRWGCPSWAPISDDLAAQFRMANELRNTLVEIERRYDHAREALWATIPAVAATQADLDAAYAHLEAVRDRAKAARVDARSTRPAADTRAALGEAKRAVAAAKDARAAARKKHAKAYRAALAPWTRARDAAVKALYGDFVQERGLGWGTYNALVDKHRISRDRVIAARTQGATAEHRFRRFDGGGIVHVQVQRDKHGDRRRVWSVEAPRPRSAWLRRPARRDTTTARGGRDLATFRVAVRTRHRKLPPLMVELPVIMHRPLPPGADVCDIEVTCTMVAGKPRLAVALTCLLPAPAARVDGATVAMKLHWDHHGDGWIRAAMVSSAGAPLPPVPPRLAGIVRVGDDGHAANVFYPPEWGRLIDRDRHIRSVRDQLIDELRAHLVDRTRRSGTPDEIVDLVRHVDKWRAPWRFVRLGRQLADLAVYDVPGAAALAGDVETWRRRDDHLWKFEVNETDQVLARRRDAWRQVGAWLCADASMLVLHQVDLAALRRRPEVGEEDTEQGRRGRAQAVMVAPHELREAVRNAALRRGIAVVAPPDTGKSSDQKEEAA